VTLDQLLGATRDEDELSVVELEITDSPQFVWRGAHLDVARHFFSVETVCRFMDLLAAHKLNILHLHLNDDQGWRLEIPSWPKLCTVGSRRNSSPLGHESDGVGDGVTHEGFYNADDVGTLIAYARERFITIVPEIDMPGHVQAILAAYSQFATSHEPLEVRERWGISSHVMNLQEPTLAFAEEILAYVGQLFPGPYVHIGGDECPRDEWAESESTRQRMNELGIVELDEVQGYFTNRFANAVAAIDLVDTGPTNERRRRAVAWDEVLDSSVPSDVIITAWRHSSEAVRAAKRGHHVVMAPMQFTYFDWPQSESPAEPVALTKPPWPTTLEKVYKFSVIPPGLEDSLHSHILGAQAQHWSEYIATREHLEYMALPRLCAFAEVLWGTKEPFEQFYERLGAHLERLGALGFNYRRLDAR
jgi:hexosaminidase